MRFIGTIISLVVILAMVGLGMLFALQNTTPVPLDVLIYTFEPRSLALWVLAAFALGGLLGVLVSALIGLRQRAVLASTRRQLARTRVELEQRRAVGSGR